MSVPRYMTYNWAASWQNQQNGIRPVWSESSLCVLRIANDPRFLHAENEDSDQTGRMPRLIWVIAGSTCHFVGFVARRLNSWIGIMLSIYIQQNWQVQIQEAIYSYIDKFYFYFFANCSLITYQLYRAILVKKSELYKENTKTLWKGPENDMKLMQK